MAGGVRNPVALAYAGVPPAKFIPLMLHCTTKHTHNEILAFRRAQNGPTPLMLNAGLKILPCFFIDKTAHAAREVK